MEGTSAEYLSAVELRNRLYHSLRNRGLVDSVKSQLRNSIVNELHTSLRGQLSIQDLKSPDEGVNILHRAANSLIANHLKACNYDYSLSVFLPESGLAQDKTFSIPDILQLLHVSSQSKLYDTLVSSSQGRTLKGFLWRFLQEMSSLHASVSHEMGVQTDLIRVTTVTSLGDKLQSLDEMYASRRDEFSRTGKVAVEDRLLSYQRQLEDRYNSELKRELARLKEGEIARIKLDEKEAGRKEADQLRREMERSYQDKYDSLVVRERNSVERLHREHEITEKDIYVQRQSMLEEIDVMRQREGEIKRERELTQREKQLQDERVKAKEEDIRRRELDIKRQETEFAQRLHNEMAQFKLDTKSRFIDRTQNLEIRETKVKEIERIVAEERSKIESLKNDLRDKTHRANELETLLQEARHSEVSATRQNEFINHKLRDMADYKTLREQNSVYRNEVETLRTRLSEVLNMNERERGRQEELMRELRRPSPETLLMQRDLEKSRENLRQEQVLFEQQKLQLETRLKDEIDRNRNLIQHFEEQTLQMKEMNREVIDLRQHLSMTKIALNNEVYRKPGTISETGGLLPALSNLSLDEADSARRLPDYHVLPASANSHAMGAKLSNSINQMLSSRQVGQQKFDTRDVYNDVDFDINVSHRAEYLDDDDDDYSSAGSADIVAETKYRLKNLDKEAQNLERAYTDFHYQMTNIAAMPDRLSPKPIVQTPSVITDEPGVISPCQSPIPVYHPMSSTPYKVKSKQSCTDYDEDSFEELSVGRDKSRKSKLAAAVPRFDISNMSDDGVPGKERVIGNRPITVSDLEARPGSPSMLVVAAGSESSDVASLTDKHQLQDVDTEDGEKISVDTDKVLKSSFPLISATVNPAPRVSSLPPISLDTAWKTEPVSLDSAWTTDAPEGRDDQTRMEDEREKREEERRRIEEEELDRKEEELMAKKESSKVSTVDSTTEDGIDPVMKRYMEMVQQQKQETKAEPQAVSKQEETQPPSEKIVSVSEEGYSAHASDDDFEW